MSLFENIDADLKQSLKDRNEQRVSTLRLLLAALKNKKIEMRCELKDEDVLATIRTQVKQLKDSLVAFEQGGRSDLVDKAKAELEILVEYQPKGMGSDELETIVKSVIEETGAVGKGDMGKVMGAVMGKVVGKADGGEVKQMVERLLG
ncbi:MAG: GatB/YqeY domain-containing protein [Candidatus Uhrbacteria bacterium]